MNPTQYEWMAIEHGDALRREADGSQLLARARDGGAAEQRHPDVRVAVRRLVDRVAGRRGQPGMDVTLEGPRSLVAVPSPLDPR